MLRRTGSISGETDAAFDLAAVIDDDQAFRTWYDGSAPRIYAYLYSRTGSVSVAEELTQETFVEIVRNPRSFDGRADAIPWLIGIARHRLSRHFRKARSDADRAETLVREITVSGDDDRPWRRVEGRDGVEAAMRAVSADQRAALMLRFVDGLSVKEIASIIGRSEDATESLVRRGRQAFEQAYRGGGHDL